jgi:hypothetical protein
VVVVTSGDPEVEKSDTSVRPLPEDRAALLFAQLDVAQARGDYAKAAEVQRELRELGWVITRKRPRPATAPPAREGVTP